MRSFKRLGSHDTLWFVFDHSAHSPAKARSESKENREYTELRDGERSIVRY
jgi:hypothetical protein